VAPARTVVPVIVPTNPAPAKSGASAVNMVAESTDLTIVFTFPIRSTQGLELDHGPFDTRFSTRKGRLLLAALVRL